MNIHQALLNCRVEELHFAIINHRLPIDGQIVSVDHADLERACAARIAAIPRAPLSRDGRWWHFPNSHAYPFGN